MQNSGIDLLFPSRAIEPLSKLRGGRWENLVTTVVGQEPISPEQIAFVLFMVRLSGCSTCQSDSFRAMRGCILCSSTTIKRYKGSDQNLIDLYDEAKKEVMEHIQEVEK